MSSSKAKKAVKAKSKPKLKAKAKAKSRKAPPAVKTTGPRKSTRIRTAIDGTGGGPPH